MKAEQIVMARGKVQIGVALLFAAAPSYAQSPAPTAYHLETKPARHIKATLTDIWETPANAPSRWAMFVPVPPSFAGQDQVKASVSIDGLSPEQGQAVELSPLHRAILWGRAAASTPTSERAVTLRVAYEATLYARHLVPGPAAAPIPTLSDIERPFYLRSSETIDFTKDIFAQWLDQNALRRTSSERDLDFARRVYLFIHKNYHYRYDDGQDRKASAISQGDWSDCGGLSNLFVAALRANGLPARTLGGRLAKSSTRASDHGQCHVRAEFYAEGIGWVPVDMSYGVGASDKNAEQYFGSDPGDLLTMYADADFILSPGNLGPKNVSAFQSISHWIWGRGTLEGSHDIEDWQVENL